MKKKDLLSIGIPENCLAVAVESVKIAGRTGYFHGKTAKSVLRKIIENPENYKDDRNFSSFATALLAEKNTEPIEPRAMVPHKIWGDIDEGTLGQFKTACSLPVAVQGAVMPDSHLGYGLNIGGVLATYNSIVPYAVGVDIACRMRLSILECDPKTLKDPFGGKQSDNYVDAICKGTKFGTGESWTPHLHHSVMDKDWNITVITKSLKDKALHQLGTSGSGNHFVEVGLLTVNETTDPHGMEVGFSKNGLTVKLAPKTYVAILSHSGSRGAGFGVCNYYNQIAKQRLPKNLKETFANLAWLDMQSEAGQEYWAAMNLMGEYAAANHELIHKNVAELIGAEVWATVENHHNFAWKETHNGQEVYVHRKGATPAGKGVFGIIPGSMADPGFLVRGKGNPDSLMSASHGAGRAMSRRQAIKTFNANEWKSKLKQRGVRLISGGLDEMPAAYKNILTVMSQQQDLVDIIARFDPKIVMMSDDGKHED